MRVQSLDVREAPSPHGVMDAMTVLMEDRPLVPDVPAIGRDVYDPTLRAGPGARGPIDIHLVHLEAGLVLDRERPGPGAAQGRHAPRPHW